MSEDVRFKQRFENFKNSYQVFLEATQAHNNDLKSRVLNVAVIHSFEMTFELSWKLLKDYLKENGIVVQFPRDAIKEAFSFGIIQDGETWIKMLEDRNSTVHEYDEKKSNEIVSNIVKNYSKQFDLIFDYFKEKI